MVLALTTQKCQLFNSKVVVSYKIFNSFFKKVAVKYKIFRIFSPVSYAVVVDGYFIFGLALTRKIYYKI